MADNGYKHTKEDKKRIAEKDANHLWALEKNIKAIAFYKRHGFDTTNEKKYEEDTTEFLVRMEK